MNFKDKKALVIDHGLFDFIAVRLGETFGKVFYFKDWENGFPTPDGAFVGYGLPNVTRVDSVFDTIRFEKPDLIVFTDVGHGDWQEDLRERGFRVFGTGKGERLEDDRVYFREVLKRLKLPVSPYKVINGGIDELKKELQGTSNKYVKISLFRGVGETFHYDNWKKSKQDIDLLAYKLGCLDGEVEFIIEDPIESLVEVGSEWFFNGNSFLPKGMAGVEIKNKGYFGRIFEYNELPKQIKNITDKFEPGFRKFNVRGALSTEIRISKDGKAYFIDPCMRYGSPPSEVLCEAYHNMSEIHWNVAEGKQIKPKERFKYAAQVMLQLREPMKTHLPIDITDKQLRYIKLRNLCKIKGQYYHLPSEGETVIGAAIGFSNDPKEAQDRAMQAAKQIENSTIYYDKDVFMKVDEQLEKAKSVGVII